MNWCTPRSKVAGFAWKLTNSKPWYKHNSKPEITAQECFSSLAFYLGNTHPIAGNQKTFSDPFTILQSIWAKPLMEKMLSRLSILSTHPSQSWFSIDALSHLDQSAYSSLMRIVCWILSLVFELRLNLFKNRQVFFGIFWHNRIGWSELNTIDSMLFVRNYQKIFFRP